MFGILINCNKKLVESLLCLHRKLNVSCLGIVGLQVVLKNVKLCVLAAPQLLCLNCVTMLSGGGSLSLVEREGEGKILHSVRSLQRCESICSSHLICSD